MFPYPEDPSNPHNVKVKAKNYGILPSWHQGAGGAAFIFIDEIEVKWLQEFKCHWTTNLLRETLPDFISSRMKYIPDGRVSVESWMCFEFVFDTKTILPVPSEIIIRSIVSGDRTVIFSVDGFG